MDHLTFDKGFWKSFIWFLVIALLICCLPWLLAKHSWIDFSTTGEIGDTIGGIMGPFIAIAAAGLTFIAFWVQYKANIQQRHDIAIERFEKFYKNLTDEERQEQRALDVIYVSGLALLCQHCYCKMWRVADESYQLCESRVEGIEQ